MSAPGDHKNQVQAPPRSCLDLACPNQTGGEMPHRLNNGRIRRLGQQPFLGGAESVTGVPPSGDHHQVSAA